MPESGASDSKMASGSWVALAHRFSCLRPRSCSGSAGECPENRYVWTYYIIIYYIIFNTSDHVHHIITSAGGRA